MFKEGKTVDERVREKKEKRKSNKKRKEIFPKQQHDCDPPKTLDILSYVVSLAYATRCFYCCDFVMRLNIAACGMLMRCIVWRPKARRTV